MTEVMRQVKETLGDEAIIMATEHDKVAKLVRITAGIDDEPLVAAMPLKPQKQTAASRAKPAASQTQQDPGAYLDALADVLDRHQLPRRLANKILRYAEDSPSSQLSEALAFALQGAVRFSSLTDKLYALPRTLVLLGQPGAGKTVTTAKIAAKLRLEKQAVDVLTTDTIKAGGVEQLANLTRILQVPLHSVDDLATLPAAVKHCRPDARVLIDTAGLDVFTETEALASLSRLSGHDVGFIWVLPTSGNADDMQEQARTLAAALPLAGILATRLDQSRRLGGLLAAVDAAGAPLCEAGMGGSIAGGLVRLNAPVLARLLLADLNMPKNAVLVGE
ncbi:MAG: hypothetical protein ACK5XX_08735 [Holosporales bacterium]|jgi:flagellar biosynthesis protein FlhF